MKSVRWSIGIIGAGCVTAFLAVDGPGRVYRRVTHEPAIAAGAISPKPAWKTDAAVAKVAEKITALTIERTGCLGTCPVYVFRIQRDRRASYDGRKYGTRTGHFEGMTYDFDRLAYFAAEKLLGLKNNYSSLVTCQATTIITVEMTDGTKRISDYGDAGPIELWTFCSAMDGVASTIVWNNKDAANKSPDPTASSVTPPPGARVAPAALVRGV